MTDDVESLVQRASRGGSDAVESLLARYLPDLQRYVRNRAGGLVRAKESSSDIVQSVCREVLERLETERLEYRGEAAFKQWLYQAALLKIMNRHRFWKAERRDAAREVAIGAQSGSSKPIEALFQSIGSPSSDAVMKENLARFEAAFGKLDEAQQTVVMRFYLEGKPHRDIAEELEITEAHSRVVLSRALARLARLAKPGDE